MRRIRRGASEDGFTMIVALGVLLVTSLLTTAVFLAVQSEARLTGVDLAGKQAYSAAQAGVQSYLNNLNANSVSGWWENCSNDTANAVTVPGSITGVQYSYKPVTNAGYTSCDSNDPADSLIDSAGNLRLAVTGVDGPRTRTVVAAFHTNSPLSYLWYTVHETLDPAADSNCTNDPFYYNQTQSNTIPSECELYWTSGDKVQGPLYTQDQLLIYPGGNPSFQSVISGAPATGTDAVCTASQGQVESQSSPPTCQSATFSGSQQTVGGGASVIPLPSDNSSLLPDAQQHGLAPGGTPPAGLQEIPSGTVTVVLNGAQATVYSCPTQSCSLVQTVPLSEVPIIYATNQSSCNTSYNPNGVDETQNMTSYNGTQVAYGPCGDIYVTGTYSKSLTLASQNDIVVLPGSAGGVINSTDNTSANSGTGTSPNQSATLGLVADQFVRVYHAGATIYNGTCENLGDAQNYSDLAPNPSVIIDAAILTLQHSFMVDDYQCGNESVGTLTVHGAIAQMYRGAVGVSFQTQNGQVIQTGYSKNYIYDPRLADLLPPYMFDLESTNWSVGRETLCSATVGNCSG